MKDGLYNLGNPYATVHKFFCVMDLFLVMSLKKISTLLGQTLYSRVMPLKTKKLIAYRA